MLKELLGNQLHKILCLIKMLENGQKLELSERVQSQYIVFSLKKCRRMSKI